jgi:hypothetical protein
MISIIIRNKTTENTNPRAIRLPLKKLKNIYKMNTRGAPVTVRTTEI